jgi:Bacterial protein of unknown function (Gcw_chp)
MQRVSVVASTLLLAGTVVAPLPAQTEAGADLALFSSYVWRGISMTNKPVFEPAIYASIPVGNASVTVGGWANIDLGKYDDLNDDITESGGSSGFNLAEFDPYAEISFPAGKATLTGGAIGYIHPNSDNAPNTFGLMTSRTNTFEVYGKLGLDVPLSPEISLYYDVDKIKGAYIEGSVSHSLAASEKVSIDLGAIAGFSAGQGISDNSGELFNFKDDGLTHLELSAGVPFTAGALSVTPSLHLVINGDERTKVTSPSNFDKDAKLWGGLTLSWSKALGPEPEPTEPEVP